MIKRKNHSSFDSFVHKILRENLQMPQNIQTNGTNPTVNASKKSEDMEDSEVPAQDEKQEQINDTKKLKSNLSGDEHVKLMQVVSSLPQELQSQLSTARTSQDVQNIVKNVDPDLRNVIINYVNSNQEKDQQTDKVENNTTNNQTLKPLPLNK